ncbi:Hypothetical predicted protein [Podarcis lilfordi]|uniref:Uncharacterized protein n=1 Tax=Podarcis lilfordi TaxID=74358 RepID=A0AA35KHS3_9SAUR|nr:Hypothetical predicted protein [Podarcis lilfordi]
MAWNLPTRRRAARSHCTLIPNPERVQTVFLWVGGEIGPQNDWLQSTLCDVKNSTLCIIIIALLSSHLGDRRHYVNYPPDIGCGSVETSGWLTAW